MPRIKTGPSAVAALRKPVHYHMLFRPFLQRRFARTSLWTFVVSSIVSFLIGNRYGDLHAIIRDTDVDIALSLFFPWTVTFLRGFAVFVTVFPILVVRKADLHGRLLFLRQSNVIQFSTFLNQPPYRLLEGKFCLSVQSVQR